MENIKAYEQPQITLVRLSVRDIIATSGKDSETEFQPLNPKSGSNIAP